MRIQYYNETFPLNGQSIDAFSEVLEDRLTGIDMERQNRLRIRLSIEEALLKMRDRFGEEASVQGIISSRFRRTYIQLNHEGDAFNPLSKTDNELEDWSSSLLTSVGLSPRYSYSGRENTLKLSLPIQGINPVLKLLVAIVTGIILGVLGTMVFPADVRFAVTDQVMIPIYDVWNRILNSISGPVIFFMVITTILNTGKITERGGDSRAVIARYFSFSVLIALASIAFGILFFRPSFGMTQIDGSTANSLLDHILQVFPKDVVTPFMKSNTPQLLVIAIILGYALNVIGEQASRLASIVKQINMIGLLLADWVSRLVPFFVFVLVAFEIWEGKATMLVDIWKYLILSLAISFLYILVAALYVSGKKQTRVSVLLKKVWHPFALTLRSGSLNSSFGQSEQCCIQKLGINREFTVISMPQGLVLFMPISVIGTLLFTIYAARLYGVQTSVLWYITAAVLAVLLFVATPPVPGANLLAYIVIFDQLGIPEAALIDAMVFDIIFGLFAAGANQMMLQFELILQADKIGLLDRECLQKP